MSAVTREGFTVRVLRGGSVTSAGVGFVVGDRHIVTCAHVVNTALGREQKSQDKPGAADQIRVEFPMLGDADSAPLRTCRVQAWAPPPVSGLSGGDVAGLVLVGEELPARAGAARLVDAATVRDAEVKVFGYPGDPPRQERGAWSGLVLRGAVGGGVIQLDVDKDSAIRAQPGYSGSPAVISGDAGDAVLGMLAVAGRDEVTRDAYAIPVSRLADAWPECLGSPFPKFRREASSVPQVLAVTLKLKRSMSSGINAVAFSPDGRMLASAGNDKAVRLWYLATGENVGTLTGHADVVRAVAFSPDGQLLASAGDDKAVRLWYLGTGQILRALTGHTGLGSRVSAVAFSPDGRMLASGGGDKTVRLWDVATGQTVRVLTGHSGRILGVEGLAFSPDGRMLASGGGDKTVRLWHVATGQTVRVLTGHSGTAGVWAVAFGPDGRLLASAGGRDKTVRLWDVATGQTVHTLTGHTGAVRAVAFSPDGRLLASGSHDKTVRLWSPATGQTVHILTGHSGLSGVEAVAFSPDGSQLASASGSTVQLWR